MPKADDFEGSESYIKYGFSIIRNALSHDEVLQVRKLLDDLFKKGPYINRRICCLDEVFKHPTLYKNIFRENIVKGLKECLGKDLTFISDFHVHHNAYVIPGWHRDCGSESGNAYLYEKNYKFAKCGIFLQDYDNGWGGSIYAKPESHLAFLTSNILARYFLKALTYFQIKFNLNSFVIPARAGDLVVFDSRLYHQSCEPSPANMSHFKKIGTGFYSIPENHTKYVIYWDSCHSDMVNDHFENLLKRANSEKLNSTGKPGEDVFFSRNLSYYYPDDYPLEIIKLVKDLDIKIPSLEKKGCDNLKRKISPASD